MSQLNPLFQHGVVTTSGDGLSIEEVSPLFVNHRETAFAARTKAAIAAEEAERAKFAAEELAKAAERAKQDAETKAAQAADAAAEADAAEAAATEADAEGENDQGPAPEKKPARSRKSASSE